MLIPFTVNDLLNIYSYYDPRKLEIFLIKLRCKLFNELGSELGTVMLKPRRGPDDSQKTRLMNFFTAPPNDSQSEWTITGMVDGDGGDVQFCSSIIPLVSNRVEAEDPDVNINGNGEVVSKPTRVTYSRGNSYVFEDYTKNEFYSLNHQFELMLIEMFSTTAGVLKPVRTLAVGDTYFARIADGNVRCGNGAGMARPFGYYSPFRIMLQVSPRANEKGELVDTYAAPLGTYRQEGIWLYSGDFLTVHEVRRQEETMDPNISHRQVDANPPEFFLSIIEEMKKVN